MTTRTATSGPTPPGGPETCSPRTATSQPGADVPCQGVRCLSIDTRTDRLRPGGPAIVRAGPLPYALSGALAAAATVSAAFSFFLPSALTGAAVGNGNLRGTALVVLMLGVPTLLMAVVGTSRGSTRWLVVWLGTLGYLLYQAVLFCLATPSNTYASKGAAGTIT